MRLQMTRFRFLSATVLMAALGWAGLCQAAADPTQVVRVIIDYNDGTQKTFKALAWSKGMTVLDAMNLAKTAPHGITFVYTGSAANAFLTKIDDLQNEGGGANKRNWLFWVNTTFADRSFGVYVLEPDDVILWRFDTFQESSSKQSK